jgi:hypothetical protein
MPTAQEFRKQSAKRVRLPIAGVEVELRQTDVLAFLSTSKGDQPPDVFAALIMRTIQEGNTTFQLKPEMLPTIRETLNKICKACFVSPRVVEGIPAPDSDDLGLDEISLQDKLFVLSWAIGTDGNAAAAFPGANGAGVGAAPAVQGVPAKAVAGHRSA